MNGRPSPAASLICAGEAFTDLMFLDLDRLPRLGEEIRTNRFVSTIGGGAVITAVAASRLGLRSGVVSALAPDAVARLKAERVGVVNLIEPGERPAVSAALSTRDDRSFVTFNGVNDRLDARLFAARARIRAPFVHFAFPPEDCARWARFASRLRVAGTVVSWDFGWNPQLVRDRGFTRLLASLDYVSVNEQEATLYTGTRTLAAAVEVWRGLARHTAIKMGGRGSRLIAGSLDLFVPVRRRMPVDTTGAGDGFNGGLLYALARGLAPAACLRVANFVGARSTRQPGGLDGLPTREDLARLKPSPYRT